jgi:DNA repair photolyase
MTDGVRPADGAALDRLFKRAFAPGRSQDGFVMQFLRHRVPIHFGGMSDPFQPAEMRFRVTESFLRTLAKYQYPTVLSTRSTLVGSEPYVSLLKENEATVVQFSFCSTRDEIAVQFEPYSSRPSELLKTMSGLTKNGIRVACRWQPYIPGISESAEHFVSSISSTGCGHVALEHLKLPMERNHPLWGKLVKALGRDLHSEYKSQNALRDSREYVLNSHIKLPAILEASKAVRARGMTFGAADNEFQYLSDTGCCCSGVDQFPGFENWFKHQIGYAIRKSWGRRITYDSISREWVPEGSIDRFLNPHSRLSTRSELPGSVRDHIRNRWNKPRASGSPATFYGVVPAPETTSTGNRVYMWDEKALGLLGESRSIVTHRLQNELGPTSPA